MCPILIGAISVSTPVLVGMLAALAAGGAFVLFKGDGRVEARRREAVRLSQLASENGLPNTGELLSAYAVGDYSGVAGAARSLYATLTDDSQREAALQVFLGKQLDRRMSDPAKREELLAAIEKRVNGLKIPRV